MTNKELLKKFKDSLQQVSEILNIEPHTLRRDLWLATAIKHSLIRLNKRQLNDLGGFSAARDLCFIKPTPTKAEIDEITKQNIMKSYCAYVHEYGITPTLKVLKDEMGYTVPLINRLFGSRLELYHTVAKAYPEIFDQLVNDSLFTEETHEKLKKNIKSKKRFIITTAVSGKPIVEDFFNSLKTYEAYEDATIIIQPCEDVASRNSIFQYELDRRLRDCAFAFKDLYLNSKFYLCGIRRSAKQIDPLRETERLAQSKGSMVLASPKQFLRFVANSNQKIPRAIMSAGALTQPDYSTDLSMSKSTSYLAEFDHKVGAIIVEIQDDRLFHFRQIQADKDGSFIDLGWRYKPDGTVEEVYDAVCVFGDTHVGSHSPDVDKCLQEITEYVSCKEIIVHDLFDCRFNNHHEQNSLTRARLAKHQKTSMRREGEITAQWLENWSERVDKITIVKSNHDEALERYLDEGRFMRDPENCYDALELAKKFIEGEDVLKYLLEDMIGYAKPTNIHWLNRDEDYMVYGIENGAHGDLGSNGSRGSMRSLEKAYYKATVGHTHTAGIWREVFQVGTSTHRKVHYNRGPSSWTNTMCIEYPNGSRQLINMIQTKTGDIYWRIQ